MHICKEKVKKHCKNFVMTLCIYLMEKNKLYSKTLGILPYFNSLQNKNN